MGFFGYSSWEDYHKRGILPNLWKGATGQLSNEVINDENLEYQRERNAIEDARYEEETAYNRAFAEDERAYQRNKDAVADARYAEETAYNRAFAEDERDYARNLQQQIFEREDTAIARQADALRAQGINPLSQNMNGLGSGSVVSSPTAPSNVGYSGGSSSPAPGLSGRGGRALQKAMITSDGINGLLGPILQTINSLDNLRGSGIQRDILNAEAMQKQAEANISVMNMLDTANRLNIPEFSFSYGREKSKKYNGNFNDGYNPYTYSPQMLNFIEGKDKSWNADVSHLNSSVALRKMKSLDSLTDASNFLTSKIKSAGGDEKVFNSFASIIESLLLKAFQ